jgi:hypothetical protein
VTFWTVVVLSIVFAGFLVLQLAPRLFPRRVGSTYFRKQLWLRGIDWRKLPRACLDDFVNEAFSYAKAASKPEIQAAGRGESFLVEYERMMRVHAIIAAALLQSKTPSEVEALERSKIESKIESAVMSGRDGMAIARAEMGTTLSIESLHVALVRAGLDPFDMAGQERISDDVQAGKTWDIQKAILRRHGILPGT